MNIKIIRDKNYGTVSATEIHGKYPYKLYLEIIGNSNIGRYIVVVSNKLLNEDEQIDEITIQLVDKVSTTNKLAKVIRQGNRPNIVGNDYFIKYRVKERSILDVGNNKIMVFNYVNKEGRLAK